MKRFFALLTACLLFVPFVYASATQQPGIAPAQVQEATITPSVDIANDPVLAEATLGNYKVAITGARIVKDYQGKPALAVSFRWSHNEKDAKSFLLAFQNKAFQNGIQLETAILMDDSVDIAGSMLEVKAGYEQNVQYAFALSDAESKVELEITELFSFLSEEKLTFTFNLK